MNVVVALSGPVLALPFVGSAPLQPPEAVHAVAFAELQESVAALPVCTVMGFAVRVTVGGIGAATVIVTAALAGEAPVAPVQLSVKVVDALSAGVVKVPLEGSAPLQPPDAVHAVAFAELQESVAVPPVLTLIVFAFSVTLGGGSVCADDDDPPEEHPPRITAHASAVVKTRWTRAAGERWFADKCARNIPRRVE